MKIKSFAVLATLALTACGGGGSSLCQSIGGTATATATAGSTITNPAQAFDGNLASFASLQPTASGAGGGVLRGTGAAQAGNGFAGVLLGKSPSGQTTQVTITTYLNGVQQESNTAGTSFGGNMGQSCPGTCEERDDAIYFGIPVSRAYDAIETTLQVSGAASTLQVKELCKR